MSLNHNHTPRPTCDAAHICCLHWYLVNEPHKWNKKGLTTLKYIYMFQDMTVAGGWTNKRLFVSSALHPAVRDYDF